MLKTINKAYQIFSKYKLNEELDVCTKCCVTQTEKQKLETENLRQIPFQLIYIHNTAATSIKPPIKEFKYFLPRYLELISINKFPSHSVELSLKRFEKYTIEEFEKDELNIIEEFCINYFNQILSHYPCPNEETIDSILIMLSKTNCNIMKILSNWKNDNSETGNQHFTDLVNRALSQKSNKLSNPFSSSKLNITIEKWLNDDKLYESKYKLINDET